VTPEPVAASVLAASIIHLSIANAISLRGSAVIGLATGATPIQTYARLVEMHKKGDLSFADVSTYNLDEYYPICPLDSNSYRSFMNRHLFSWVDLPANRRHVLDGTVPEHAVESACRAFDQWIADEGGLDLQLLGIGRNGHIGFNEPSDLTASQAAALPTRLVRLHPTTIADAARDFDGSAANVPRRALTLGTAKILSARSILVLAFGAGKAAAVAGAVDGQPSAQLPASLLQLCERPVTWILDEEAASMLAR
jgi:glucosamine-6-phosphate deaminase